MSTLVDSPRRAFLPAALVLVAMGVGAASAILPTTVILAAVAITILGAALLMATPAVIIALLILAPLSALLSVRSPGLIPLDLGQALLAASMAALVLSAIMRRRLCLPRFDNPVLTALLVFIAAGAISAFSAVSLSAWLVEWLKWILMTGMAVWVIAYRRWQWMLFAAVTAGVANAIVGVWIYFGGSGADHLLISPGAYRAFGTFEQPNPFAAFMGVLVPVAGAAAFGYLRTAWRQRHEAVWRQPFSLMLAAGYYALCALIMVAALIFSWSRGAWLAAGVGGVVVLLALPRRAVHRVLLIFLIALMGAGALATGRVPASITDRIGSAFADLVNTSDVRGADVTPENYAVVERLAHWQAAVEMARLSPLTGVGLGNYEVVYPQVRLMSWKFALGHAHNYYLNVLAEAGMIGLLAYGVLWVIVIFTTLGARSHPDPLASSVAAGLLGTWTYIVVHSVTDQVFVNYAFLHVGVLMGIAGLLHNQTWKLNRLKPL